MYTLCWVENDMDRWDRFQFGVDVKEKIKELINNGFDVEEMLVFGPDTEMTVLEDKSKNIILEEN